MTAASSTLVLGAGAWGTALAITLARQPGNEVGLWGRDESACREMDRTRENTKYLPGIHLPGNLRGISLADIDDQFDLVVAAVPVQTLRSVLGDLRATGFSPACLACACKGLERDTFARPDQICADVFSESIPFAMLSGPNFAREVAEGRPAAITVGTNDGKWGETLVSRFHNDVFRPYMSDDAIGVQIGGALKNVIAIAAGISDGLNLGANSRAALITRGLAEITRFGVAQGGRQETFMGLSGLGDLVLTCTDDTSRNRRFGLRMAAGDTAQQAMDTIGVVEGAVTALALVEYARAQGIELPISNEVAATINGDTSPAEAVRRLLARDPVDENAGLTFD